jgi:hypothetical protein
MHSDDWNGNTDGESSPASEMNACRCKKTDNLCIVTRDVSQGRQSIKSFGFGDDYNDDGILLN